MKLKKPETLDEIQSHNLNLLKLGGFLNLSIALKNYMDDFYFLMAASCICLGMCFGVWWVLWLQRRWRKNGWMTGYDSTLPTPQA